MTSKARLKKKLKDRFIELSKPMEPISTGTEPRLEKLKGIRTIIYDFYGTLFLSGVGDIGIDDGKSDATLVTDALKSSGIIVKNEGAGERSYEIYTEVVLHETEKLKKAGIEYPEPDIRKIWEGVLSRLHGENLIDSIPDTETPSRVSVEFEARMNPVWPFSDAEEILIYFKKKQMIQGIISNSQFYTPIVLEALTGKSLDELGFHKELLHWSFLERRKKPDLSFYTDFLDKLKRVDAAITPEQVLYAGNDMLKDIWPASQLGMKTALFAGDKRSLKWRRTDERCKNLEPDIVFTEFVQLKEVV